MHTPILETTPLEPSLPTFEPFVFTTGSDGITMQWWSLAPIIPRLLTPSFPTFPEPPHIGASNTNAYVRFGQSSESQSIKKELSEIELAVEQNQQALPQSSVSKLSNLTTYTTWYAHPKLMDSLARLNHVNESLREQHNQHNHLSSLLTTGFKAQGSWNRAIENQLADTDMTAKSAIALVSNLTHESNQFMSLQYKPLQLNALNMNREQAEVGHLTNSHTNRLQQQLEALKSMERHLETLFIASNKHLTVQKSQTESIMHLESRLDS